MRTSVRLDRRHRRRRMGLRTRLRSNRTIDPAQTSATINDCIPHDKRMGDKSMRIEHPTGRPNLTIVHLDHISIAFSYETPIGFQLPTKPWVVRENDWSNTTGKHLNWLDGGDKSARIPGSEFEERLSQLTGGS